MRYVGGVMKRERGRLMTERCRRSRFWTIHRTRKYFGGLGREQSFLVNHYGWNCNPITGVHALLKDRVTNSPRVRWPDVDPSQSMFVGHWQ